MAELGQVVLFTNLFCNADPVEDQIFTSGNSTTHSQNLLLINLENTNDSDFSSNSQFSSHFNM